jgi:hypothetical protein
MSLNTHGSVRHMRYAVRITPTSARERLSGPLHDVDLTEAELRSRVIEPYDTGGTITLRGRSLGTDDITRVEIACIEPGGVAGTPLAQLRALWQQRPRQVVDWLIANAPSATNQFITGPPGSAPPAREPSEELGAAPSVPALATVVTSSVGFGASVAAVVLAPGWLAGGIVGFVAGAALLRRHIWRARPAPLAVIGLIVAVALAGLIGVWGHGLLHPARHHRQADRAPSAVGRLSTVKPLVIDNRVTDGPHRMREDAHPVKLSATPEPFCGGRCLRGTGQVSGGRYDGAVCQTRGGRVTNGDDSVKADDTNPGLFSSDRYYGVRLAGGTFGYLSEVWVRRADRGGLGLPPCPS